MTLVSVGSDNAQGNGSSALASVSTDGRAIAFQTQAGNFAIGDSNGAFDVYVRDLNSGNTFWASMMPDGSAGYFGAEIPSISADGKYVSFHSSDSLVPEDNGGTDVFVRDLVLGETDRASVSHTGGQPNGDSYPSAISGDGRHVAFLSLASNLVPHDKNGGSYTGVDAFVRDLVLGTTELVHLSTSGEQGDSSAYQIAISGDGRFVMYTSFSTNLVPGDTNGKQDVFVRDRINRETIRVSVDSDGNQSNDSSIGILGISTNGRFAIFESPATNLVSDDTNGFEDVFMHDLWNRKTIRVSVGTGGIQGDAGSTGNAISADGRYVAFGSGADNFVPGGVPQWGALYVRDLLTDATRRTSINCSGAPANGYSLRPALSADGYSVVYDGTATNLVPGDVNGHGDVFLVRHLELSPAVYCTATTNSQGCLPAMSWTGTPSASGQGGFELAAANVASQRNGALIYSITGPTALPFQGGTLCLAAPLVRTGIQNSGGQGLCSGAFQFEFNAYAASGTNPALVVGQSVWAQYWSRDPGSAGLLNLTDAIFFVLDP